MKKRIAEESDDWGVLVPAAPSRLTAVTAATTEQQKATAAIARTTTNAPPALRKKNKQEKNKFRHVIHGRPLQPAQKGTAATEAERKKSKQKFQHAIDEEPTNKDIETQALRQEAQASNTFRAKRAAALMQEDDEVANTNKDDDDTDTEFCHGAYRIPGVNGDDDDTSFQDTTQQYSTQAGSTNNLSTANNSNNDEEAGDNLVVAELAPKTAEATVMPWPKQETGWQRTQVLILVLIIIVAAAAATSIVLALTRAPKNTISAAPTTISSVAPTPSAAPTRTSAATTISFATPTPSAAPTPSAVPTRTSPAPAISFVTPTPSAAPTRTFAAPTNPADPNGEGEHDSPLEVLGINYQNLQYRVVDAEYSKALDRIIMVSSDPQNQLHVYDALSGTDTAVYNLPAAPACVSVSPDGTKAAVGHDGWVSYVDLTISTSPSSPSSVGVGVRESDDPAVQTFQIATDVFDIVLAGNGFIYAFPRHDQWVKIHCLDASTGIETLSTGRSLYDRTRARLHPSGTKIYGADNGLSPSDFERYDITQGTAAYAYDSPYHGDYSIGGNLWFSEDGGRIFVKGRSVFRSSDIREMDMLYAGSVGTTGSMTTTTTIEFLDHSSMAGLVAVIPAFHGFWNGGQDGSDNTDGQIEFYEESFLGRIGTLPLPKFLVPGSSNSGQRFDAHGKFIFFDRSGEYLHVIAQADATSNMLYDYATISIATNVTDMLSI